MKTQLMLAAMLTLAMAAPANAQYCREFTQRILVGGKFQQGYGTSCLMPDGSWKITEAPNLREPSPVNFFYTPPPVTYVQPVAYYQDYYAPPRSYYRPNVSVINFSYGNRPYWRHKNGWHRGHYKRHGRHRHH